MSFILGNIYLIYIYFLATPVQVIFIDQIPTCWIFLFLFLFFSVKNMRDLFGNIFNILDAHLWYEYFLHIEMIMNCARRNNMEFSFM